MIEKIKKHLTTSDAFDVMIIVIAVALLFGISIFQSTMTWRTDAYFHLSRIYDITEYVKAFQLPLMVDIHAFANTGQAINGMYPNFSLLPFIFCTAWLKPLAQYETIIVLFILLGSILNYFVFQKLHASKLQSMAAVFFIFTFINIFYQSSLNLHGVWSVYFLLPLAILSLNKISAAKNKYIISLSFAVSFVLNTHLLNAVLLVGVLFIHFIYLMTKAHHKLPFLRRIILAAIFGILLSLPTLVSIFSFIKTNLSTVQEIPLTSGTLNIESMIHSLTNPTIFGAATPPIFGMLLVADVLLLGNIKNFNSNAKVVVLFVFIAQFLISPYFPWALFQNTVISIIQFPTRLVPFILIIITMVLFTSTKLNKVSFLLIIILGSFGLAFSYQTSNYVAKKSFSNFETIKKSSTMNKFDSILKYNENTKVNNKTLSNPAFYRLYSYHEYIPQTITKNDPKLVTNMKTVNNHELFVNQQKVANVKTIYKNNEIKFTFAKKEKGTINLPVWYYPNMQYAIKADNGMVSVNTSKRHTLEIKNASTKHVTVKITNPQSITFSYLISGILWFIGLVVLPVWKIRSRCK